MKPLVHFFLSSIILWGCFIIPAVHSLCIKDQQLSLLQLKNNLVFLHSPSTKLTSWNASSDCCSWVGVTCSRDGRVLGLDLSNQDISGGIDNSSSLFHLRYLQSLNLASNYLGQSIPSAIGNLLNLRYLNLSFNWYSGKIPNEISRLKKLLVLDFSFHRFEFELKLGSPNLHKLVQNLTELKELHLDLVQISEPGSEWGRAISSSLPNLRVLSMSFCDLSGPFHESLAKLQSLSVINLKQNNISAPVPKFFSNFSNLTVLNLDSCELQGTFPKEIFQLPSLQSIVLSSNSQLIGGCLPEFPSNGFLQHLDLRWTNFSGLLPSSIGNLKMLSTIDITDCNFSGPIPKSMANLTHLISFSMARNNLEGSLPSFSGAKNLGEIDLSGNRLTGTINSTHWANLTKLTSLDLSSNELDGNIPASVSSLPLLYSLDLSNNHFSGPLPMSIFSLHGLLTLALSSNNLSGSFPLDGLHQLRDLHVLDLSRNNLFLTHDYTNSSFPPLLDVTLASLKLRTIPNFLRNQYLYYLDLSDNQISGKVPNWIWYVSASLNLSCNSLLDTLDVINRGSHPESLSFLDLHSNQFYGKMPIFKLVEMVNYLDLSRNHFNSSIPSDIGDVLSDIKFLSFSSNNLSGVIPESLCHSRMLEVLDLSNNSLSGTVPQCLTTTTRLSVLNLRRNNLTNVDEFSHNCSLETLDLSGNQIQGRFLKSLVNCIPLEVLNLGNNLITAPFPCFLRKIATLRVLVLRSNKFYGDIGCGWTNGTWPLLQIIDLSQNNFTGEVLGTTLTTWQAMMRTHKDIATSKIGDLQFKKSDSYYQEDTITVTTKGKEIELMNVLTIFTVIDFSSNKFTGLIPEEIGELISLYALNLSNNAFTGALPSSLSNMCALESLDLSKNKLSGRIPPELTKLTFLAFLNLSYNQLEGRIPTGAQFSTFDADSFYGNKGLWGPPLTEDNRTSPKVEVNHSDPGNEIDWDIICPEIGFTCGFGIAVGSLLFCKRWRKWYFRAMYHILLKVFPQLEQRIGHHRRHVHINQRYWRRSNGYEG